MSFVTNLSNSISVALKSTALELPQQIGSKKPVHIIATGYICSMGVGILMSGCSGHRLITENTSIMTHNFSRSRPAETYTDALAHRYQEDQLYDKTIKLYIKHTNLDTEQEVKEKLLKGTDTWLTCQEAVSFGIADRIIYDPLDVDIITAWGEDE